MSEKSVLPLNQILLGDAHKLLQTLPPESIDCLVTDPPYGLSFMGKDWDKAVPSVDVWRECLRVLKSGSFAFIMSSPRLDCLSQMAIRLSEARFNVGFTPIYWVYASGFPKAENIGKMVDKKLGFKPIDLGSNPNKVGRHEDIRSGNYGSHVTTKEPADGRVRLSKPSSEKAKILNGSYGGFQPKPAVEIIIVAMKPLSEKSYVDQALKNGKGVTWLDDARIPFQNKNDQEATDRINTPNSFQHKESNSGIYGKYAPDPFPFNLNRGRFPANLLVCDDVLNDGSVDRGTKPHQAYSTVDSQEGWGSITHRKGELINFGDSGSFSRYFDLDAWFKAQLKELPESVRRVFPFLIVPKAAKTEREKGLESQPVVHAPIGNVEGRDLSNPKNVLRDGMQNRRARNIHPTVKPVKLMSYLIILGSRSNDVVLDPFIGSGSTALAARLMNRQFIGIEINSAYVEIARKRLSSIPAKLDGFFQ